jgi:N-methylhydantoinase A
MRYSMQIHDVEVPLAAGALDDVLVAQLEHDFEDIHDQLFGKGSGYRAGGIDITAFQVRATAQTTKPQLAADVREGGGAAVRRIYWPELQEHVDTPVYDAAPPGELAGPALIQLPDTVIVVRPGHSGRVDELGNYVLDLGTMNG